MQKSKCLLYRSIYVKNFTVYKHNILDLRLFNSQKKQKKKKIFGLLSPSTIYIIKQEDIFDLCFLLLYNTTCLIQQLLVHIQYQFQQIQMFLLPYRFSWLFLVQLLDLELLSLTQQYVQSFLFLQLLVHAPLF
jgi:hypothetical protein